MKKLEFDCEDMKYLTSRSLSEVVSVCVWKGGDCPYLPYGLDTIFILTLTTK